MTTIRLHQRHKEWLKTASKAQSNAWLSKGPIEIGSFGDFGSKEFKTTYGAFIRGVLVGRTDHKDAKGALKDADKAMAKIKAGPLEFVDEEALGIGTSNMTLVDRLDQATVAFQVIFHLGAQIAADDKRGDAFEEFIRDMDDHAIKALKSDLPFIANWWKEIQKEGREDDEDENASEFLQRAMDAGRLGFLVQVAHPVMDWNKDGKSASFSWGHYNTAWVYGESLIEVADRAVAWAGKLDKAAQKKAKDKTA